MTLRGENILSGWRTGSKLSANTPLKLASMATSIAEGTRGNPFRARGPLPHHDHAYTGTRIDRSIIFTLDGGTGGPVVTGNPAATTNLYGIKGDGSLNSSITTLVGGKPNPSMPPIALGYCVGGLSGDAISGSPPAIEGKALVSVSGGGSASILLYCRESEDWVEVSFSNSSPAWVTLSSLDVVSGSLSFEIYLRADTGTPTIEIWNLTFSETRTKTQPEAKGSYIFGSDPRP